MTANSKPLRTLLYRYFFYGWLFRDVQCGTVWEQRAARQHNCEQARWLPTYMRRWAVVGPLMFGLALMAELGLQLTSLSALLYVPSVMCVPFLTVTGVAWWLMTHPPQRNPSH